MCSEDGTPCTPCAAKGKFRAPLLQGRGLHAGAQLEVLTEQAGQDLLVWGPASVEAVSEDAKLVRMTAIEAALPDAFRRGLISILHKDQVAGHYRPLQPLDLARVPQGRGRKLAEYLVTTYGGAPTAVLEVTPEIAEAFPHLNPYVGTRQFFAGGAIYGDTDTALFIQEEVRQGRLNAYSISGMPTDTRLLTVCDADTCKEVEEVHAIDLSAITLGSIQGGEGPFSAKVRNPGAAFLLLQQAIPDPPETQESGGEAGGALFFGQGDCSGVEDHMSKPPASKKPTSASLLAQAEPVMKTLTPDQQKILKAVFEQVDDSTVTDDVKAMFAEFSRRLEAMEQRLAQAPTPDEKGEEKAPEEEAEEKDNSEAIEQAATKAAEKALAGVKQLLAQAKPAETPHPVGKPAGEADSAATALLEAAATGDPAALRTAWQSTRGGQA